MLWLSSDAVALTLLQGTLPYMIALDWERRAIVLGVRGT